MTLEEKTLQRPDGIIHYWIGGKRAAPLVVLTHGATIDHHEWDATIPVLEDRYQVLTWDIRGTVSHAPCLSFLQKLRQICWHCWMN